MDFQRMAPKDNAGRFERGYLKTITGNLTAGLGPDAKSRRIPILRGALLLSTFRPPVRFHANMLIALPHRTGNLKYIVFAGKSTVYGKNNSAADLTESGGGTE
jgi:hypothetical protein